MRLISLNAWGGNLYEPLAAYLASVNADILCLQEVTWAAEPTPEKVFFRNHGFDLPQHEDLFAALSKTLTDHQCQFLPASQGDVVDHAGNPFLSRFGLATFVHRDFAIAGQAHDFVHGAYVADGWGTPPVPRNMHALRLIEPQTGKPFIAAHLHGLRDPAGKHDTPDRVRQTERIVELLLALRRNDEPMILCGDLNLLPDSGTFDRLAEIGLKDLVTANGFTDTRTSLYEKPQRYADYLLVTPGIEVRHFDVVAEPEVSDHRALLLDFVVA